MLHPIQLIKNIIHHLKELKEEASKTLNNNAEILESGIWRVNSTLTVFYKQGYNRYRKKEETKVAGRLIKFHDSDMSTKIAAKLLAKTYKYVVRVKNNLFTGQVCIVGTNGKKTKSINYKEDRIFTKYKNPQIIKEEYQKRLLWGDTHKIVPFYEINYERLFTIEKYIKTVNCSYDFKFKLILQDYIKCFYSMKIETRGLELTDEQKNKIENACAKLHLNNITTRLFEFLKNGYIRTLSHGDMSYYNVLYDGNDISYIDFEFLNKRFFLHDLFYYLYFLKWLKNNYLIKNYFKGKYDKEFSQLFSLCGLTYNKNNRKVYFLAHLLDNLSFNCNDDLDYYKDVLTLK